MAGAIKETASGALLITMSCRLSMLLPLSYLDQMVNRVVMVIDVIVTPYIEL